jgi:ABC-2 type transport system ATP-binding protein
MDIAIETLNLTRRFGTVLAVDSINLRVERGTFYGFLGPNGAGKSTTIKMLTGLLAPTSGVMRILGRDISNPQEALEAKRRVGVVPENLHLFENLTAREFLVFTGRMYSLPRDVIAARTDELLQMMNLENEHKKLALEFSHGMRKKLALAAALLPNPDLLFLDEPFEGVDAVASRVLRDTLRQCVARGATVFLTSHVLEIVEKLCSHVGIISKGQLVHQQPMAELGPGSSLEERFLQVVGAGTSEHQKLSWLEPSPAT